MFLSLVLIHFDHRFDGMFIYRHGDTFKVIHGALIIAAPSPLETRTHTHTHLTAGGCRPGMYAIEVVGELPAEVLEFLAEKRIPYHCKPADTSNGR